MQRLRCRAHPAPGRPGMPPQPGPLRRRVRRTPLRWARRHPAHRAPREQPCGSVVVFPVWPAASRGRRRLPPRRPTPLRWLRPPWVLRPKLLRPRPVPRPKLRMRPVLALRPRSRRPGRPRLWSCRHRVDPLPRPHRAPRLHRVSRRLGARMARVPLPVRPCAEACPARPGVTPGRPRAPFPSPSPRPPRWPNRQPLPVSSPKGEPSTRLPRPRPPVSPPPPPPSRPLLLPRREHSFPRRISRHRCRGRARCGTAVHHAT